METEEAKAVLLSSKGIEHHSKIHMPKFITPKQREKLENIIKHIADAFGEIGEGYNKALPEFFYNLSIITVSEVEGVIESIGKQDLNNEGSQDKIEEYIQAAEIAILGIGKCMVERRNLSWYIKTNRLPDNNLFPLPFTKFEKVSKVREKLWVVDNQISKEIGKINIHPVAGLWGVAKNLLELPNEAGEYVADIILEGIRFMLKDPLLREHLNIKNNAYL